MSDRPDLLDVPADRRNDPRRAGWLLVAQAFFTVIAVVCLVVEWVQHDETPWLVVTAVVLLCVSLGLSARSYWARRG